MQKSIDGREKIEYLGIECDCKLHIKNRLATASYLLRYLYIDI